MSNSSRLPLTVAHQAPLSMGFSRQESWSGLPFPSPGDLPDPGFEPGSPALQMESLPSDLRGKPAFKYVSDGASLVAQSVMNLLAVQETQVQTLGQEDPLEKGLATHFSTVALRIP